MTEDGAKTGTGAAATEPFPVLVAFDQEDLAVISANLQDALVRLADMAYLPASRRFALALARFDWVAAEHGRMERSRTGLHFEGVQNVMRAGFAGVEEQGVLNLLSIVFEETNAPGGRIVLTFSGGAEIRLEVECLEAQMHDIGPRWPTASKPGHAIDNQT